MTVTWSTVRRLFSGLDIAAMREVGYHLDNYEHVVQNFNLLYDRIADGSMPPRPFGPWPRRKIELLKLWKDAGFPIGPVVEENDRVAKEYWEHVENFVGLSEVLTGFDSLHNDLELGAKYLERMYSRAESDPGSLRIDLLDELIEDYQKIGKMKERHKKLKEIAVTKLRQDDREDYINITRQLVMLWYTGSFVNGAGFPDGDNGTPQDNQYIDGLVWPAGKTHPMGYTTEGYVPNPEYKSDGPDQRRYVAYWELEPGEKDDPKHTGLGDTATHTPTSPPEFVKESEK